MDLDTGVDSIGRANGNFHSRYSCLKFVYLREVYLVSNSRAVIGHLFYLAREADLARAEGAQSNWWETNPWVSKMPCQVRHQD
jgi:hypothetical protein